MTIKVLVNVGRGRGRFFKAILKTSKVDLYTRKRGKRYCGAGMQNSLSHNMARNTEIQLVLSGK